MVRPLRAAEALARQMGERFEQIQADAMAAIAAAALPVDRGRSI